MRLVCKNHDSRQRGSTLLVCLFIALIVAAALGCYLQLVTNQNQLGFRSQTWNCSLALAEAGLEEALDHCSYNAPVLAAQGWALASSRYSKSNSVGVGFYVTSISSNAPYDINSTGYYPMPNGQLYVSRSIKVTTTAAPRFLGAMESKSTIDINGNPVTIDSYDSRTNTYSTNGKYDPAKRRDHADVMLSSSGTSFDLGNGNIYGHAYTGPSVTVTTGPNGAIGDIAWNVSHSGIEPGWWLNTANIAIPDVSAPFVAATPPASGTVGGVFHDYVLANGNYEMPALSGKCAVTGNAVLYVTGNINCTLLTIQPGASVKIYCAGATASFNTVNNNATAVDLQYFGMPTNTSLDLGGNWVGGVYAPQTSFSVSGNNEISGALVAKSIRMRGSCAFHYDEALGSPTASGGVIITSWNEL